jgi:zinc transport system substrate-binding protein
MIKRILTLLFVCFATQAQAGVPSVVVSIQPIHALVAGVMDTVAVPKLLLSPHEDAHHFSLTPTEARAISKANLVIWVGPQMEMVLEKAIKNIATNGRVLTLLDVPGIALLKLENGQVDPHMWLDPLNAKVIVQQVATALSGIDPDHSGVYGQNAAKLIQRLDALDAKLKKELEPLKGKPYFVYHDAFQYFERAFGLERSIPVVKDTEHTLRATQREMLEEQKHQKHIQCVFGEPNHGEKVVQSLAEQMGLQVGFLDPISSRDTSSPAAPYFDMMEQLASSLTACLAGEPAP